MQRVKFDDWVIVNGSELFSFVIYSQTLLENKLAGLRIEIFQNFKSSFWITLHKKIEKTGGTNSEFVGRIISFKYYILYTFWFTGNNMFALNNDGWFGFEFIFSIVYWGKIALELRKESLDQIIFSKIKLTKFSFIGSYSNNLVC